MYFDTLKVSTVEEATSQVSARGGRGNAEQIIWDYGKEITLTLEDALYTPASQSLMWGAKYRILNSKIRGAWNPIVYQNKNIISYEVLVPENIKLDDYEDPYIEYFDIIEEEGKIYFLYHFVRKYINTKHYDDFSRETVLTDEDLKQYYKTVNPITKEIFYFRPFIEADSWSYKYLRTEEGHPEIPKKYITDVEKYKIVKNSRQLKGYFSADLIDKKSWVNEERPEIAELIIENFGDFSLQREIGTEVDEEIGGTKYLSNMSESNEFFDYRWEKVGLKMMSLEGEHDVYFMEDCGLSYQTRHGFENKYVTLSAPKLTTTHYNDEIPDWEITDEEVDQVNPLDRVKKDRLSYKKKNSLYEPEIVFQILIKELNPIDHKYYEMWVPVGTFYIITDWNSDKEVPAESIYPIEKGFDQVRYIERMEKCMATNQFAINTDNNLLHSNYRLLQQYNYTELTVYINPKTMKPYIPNTDRYTKKNGEVIYGNYRVIKENEVYYKWTRTKASDYTSNGNQLIIDAEHFPGTYKLVGETYRKDRIGGTRHYQFEIPLAKLSPQNKLTLQADGEPTIFSMKLKALRREDGVMMKITEYETVCNFYGDNCSGSTKVVPIESIDEPQIEKTYDYKGTARLAILHPPEGDEYPVSMENNIEDIIPEVGLIVHGTNITTVYDRKTLRKVDEITIASDTVEKLRPGKDYTITIKDNRDGGE